MRLFGLTIARTQPESVTSEKPAPERPTLHDLWAGLDLDEKVAPSWPKIHSSPIWQAELVPWFRALLIQSVRMLSVERDAERIHDLQVRIALLEGLIQQPETEHQNLKRLIQNRYGAGEDPDELRAQNG